MRPLRSLLMRLRDLFRKDALDAETAAELSLHLDLETEENVRRGMTPAEARAAALRSLGQTERIREDCRRSHGLPRLESLWGDLRFALRGLRRQPVFALAAILTLALGVGANTAIFSVVRGVVLRPLPFSEPARLVHLLGYDRTDGVQRGTISMPNFVDVREAARSFSSMSVFDEWTAFVEWPEGGEILPGATVSASFFDTLGVAPAAGRFFLPEEDVPGAARSLVVSHGVWQRRFGGDPAALGTVLEINGYAYELVGVAPPGLEDPGLGTPHAPSAELWRSPRTYFGSGSDRDGRAFTAMARLRPGVALDEANAELDALLAGLEAAHPDDNADLAWIAVPAAERIVGDLRRPLWLLLAAASLVLLVACANVANLLLARADRRRDELAVRAMVGASRARVIRQLAVESLTLAALGTGAGLLVAHAGLRLLVVAGADSIPRWAGVAVDAPVLAFAAGLAFLTALLFGLAPALRLARTDLESAIDSAGRGSTAGGRAFRIEGRPAPEPGEETWAETRVVSAGWFRTAGVPIEEGRGFTGADRTDGALVAVIDRAAAERFWPGETALGQRFTMGDRSFEIVGVVGAVRQFGLDQPVDPTFYLPMAQSPRSMWIDSALLVRAAGAPEDLAGALRAAVREVDPGIAIHRVTPMREVVGGTYGDARFRTFLLSVFAGLALVLGMIGLYGVVAYATAERSRELGIRMALGAERARVLALVMRDGLAPAALGVAIGLAGAAALAGALESVLFQVGSLDPAVYLGAAALLLATAALACFLPARRATRTDPAETLRA